METATIVLDIPYEVSAKLATGEYTRNGSVIQDDNGQIIMWLREGTLSPPNPDDMTLGLPSKMGNMLQLAGATASILNLGVTIAFGRETLSKLNKIDKKLDVIIEKLDEIERKVDKLQWSVDMGFANTLQALDNLKSYQEIGLAGELNSATSLAWSCQFLEPESTKRVMRIEQAFSKSSGVVEKLLLHTETEMNQAIEWMVKKREKSSDFEIDNLIIQSLFRFRQTCIACSVNASIQAEAGDTYSVSVKLLKDQKRLSELLYQLVNIAISTNNGEPYKNLLDKSMVELMPIERIGRWVERFDLKNKNLNKVLETLRESGFSSNGSENPHIQSSIAGRHRRGKLATALANREVQVEKTEKNANTLEFFNVIDGLYEDLDRLKGHSLEYKAMNTMHLTIHQYRDMLQVNELPNERNLVFIQSSK